MSERSRVVVMGTTAEEPPPGIHVVDKVVDLAYADSAEARLTTSSDPPDSVRVIVSHYFSPLSIWRLRSKEHHQEDHHCHDG